MDENSHLRDEESNGWRDRETPPSLMVIVRSMEEAIERLIRVQPEDEELNVVPLQSLSEI